MTEITRSIEISAPTEKVWSCIDPTNWSKIFSSVKEVDGVDNKEVGVGSQFKVVAGIDELITIKYNIEITEYLKNNKIVYRRFGGPLTGRGVIKLKSLQHGTMLVRTSRFDDDLSEETMDALSEGMEKDNKKIRELIKEMK
ncbi:MAG: SRPBCC family protein [bacterium]